MTIILTILTIAVYVILLSFLLALDAPWVPTRKDDVRRFLALAEIKPGQVMYDLGCGDARLVCAAAEAGADARGVDRSLFPLILAHVHRWRSPSRSRIKLLWRNVWTTDLRDADLVYVWLMPKVIPKLKAKFEKELKPGAKVISYVWPLEGWQPLKIDDRPNRCKLYLYQKS